MSTTGERSAALFAEAVPLDELRTLPGNPRLGDVDAIARSLSAFGQRKAIVAKRDGTVIAGNHTLAAARQLAWSEIAVVYVDDDDATAKAYALADNRTAELGSYDEHALLALIDAVADEDAELLSATGWADDDIAELLRRLDETSATIDLDEREPFSVYERELIVETAFEHYRANGFPYRKLSLLDCMQQINALASTPADSLVTTTTAYHVADTYHPHRVDGHALGMHSPLWSFGSDKHLRRAFRLILDEKSMAISDAALFSVLAFVSTTQACSNFRPGFALALYRELAPAGATVLDTSTGYGGRLVGFLASDCDRYIGIDPSTRTDAGNRRLVADLGAHKSVELINLPAEDVDVEPLRERCHFALTSPPYFAKEHYADEATQSSKRYREPVAWRDGFLRPMLKLTFDALVPGAHAAVNIADVDLRGKAIPLEGWTRDCGADVGFELLDVRRFRMPRAMGRGEPSEDFEPVFMFRKPPA